MSDPRAARSRASRSAASAAAIAGSPGLQAVALEQPLDDHVDVALAGRVVGGVVERRDDLADDLLDALRRRASAPRRRRVQRSGTTFVPPTPPLDRARRSTVVSSSMRPCGIAAIACAAARDRAAAVLGPDPGVRGAAEQLGLPAHVRRRGDDDLADRRGVVEDVARARCAAAPTSNALAPASARSSLTVNSSSMPTGEPSSVARRASSSSIATAALLSAPRIVSPALSQPPSTSTGSTGALVRDGVEVRAEQHAALARGPGCARAGCRHSAPISPAAPSSSTLQPERAQLAAHARRRPRARWPDGLAIAQSSANVSFRRRRSTSDAGRTAQRRLRRRRGSAWHRRRPARRARRSRRVAARRSAARRRTRGTAAPGARAAT